MWGGGADRDRGTSKGEKGRERVSMREKTSTGTRDSAGHEEEDMLREKVLVTKRREGGQHTLTQCASQSNRLCVCVCATNTCHKLTSDEDSEDDEEKKEKVVLDLLEASVCVCVCVRGKVRTIVATWKRTTTSTGAVCVCHLVAMIMRQDKGRGCASERIPLPYTPTISTTDTHSGWC